MRILVFRTMSQVFSFILYAIARYLSIVADAVRSPDQIQAEINKTLAI